jgi:hypothetical protein
MKFMGGCERTKDFLRLFLISGAQAIRTRLRVSCPKTLPVTRFFLRFAFRRVLHCGRIVANRTLPVQRPVHRQGFVDD